MLYIYSILCSEKKCLFISRVAFKTLLSDGGWVDTQMTIGVKGMYEIIRRRYQGYSDSVDDVDADVNSIKEKRQHAWRLDREGNLENDIMTRGVEDLPKYYFRDDALALYRVIKKYVATVVNAHYKGIALIFHLQQTDSWGTRQTSMDHIWII